MRCTLATAGPLSPFSSVGRAIGGAGGLVLLPLFAIHPLLPGGLPGLHRTQKEKQTKGLRYQPSISISSQKTTSSVGYGIRRTEPPPLGLSKIPSYYYIPF